MIINIFKKVHVFLLPYTCILCEALSDQELDLCQGCENDLPWHRDACPQCAQPLGQTSSSSLQSPCGQCLKNPPPFTQTIAAFRYEMPISQWVNQLKFYNQLLPSQLLGALLAKKIKAQSLQLPQCIIPVPLHKQRLIKRGYNQTHEIAKTVAHILQIPIDPHYCQRIRATAAQTEIPQRQRYSNIKNAFQAKSNKVYQHLAIVDDVVTTGATVSELAKTLLLNGVHRVDIWCSARTV